VLDTLRTAYGAARDGFRSQMSGANRGQMGGNMVQLFIGVMVAAVLGVQVVIPVINDAINTANVSGTEQTILGLLGTFVALLLLISLASPLMRRV